MYIEKNFYSNIRNHLKSRFQNYWSSKTLRLYFSSSFIFFFPTIAYFGKFCLPFHQLKTWTFFLETSKHEFFFLPGIRNLVGFEDFRTWKNLAPPSQEFSNLQTKLFLFCENFEVLKNFWFTLRFFKQKFLGLFFEFLNTFKDVTYVLDGIWSQISGFVGKIPLFIPFSEFSHGEGGENNSQWSKPISEPKYLRRAFH